MKYKLRKTVSMALAATMVIGVAQSAAAGTHVVQEGEWLSTIAPKYDTTWQNLAEANKLDNPDLIYPGQKLDVPDGNEKPAPAVTPAPSAVKVKGTVEADDVNGTTTYMYVTEDWVRDQNSAMPLLLVYGDKPFTEASVKEYVAENNLDALLADYRGNAVFVNPANGKNWTDADVANYASIAKNINHKSDTPIVKADGKEDVYAGFYGRLYIAAEGSGADFINTKVLPAYDEGKLDGTVTVGNGDALPTSVMLFGATEAPTAKTLKAMPAALYGCSEAVVDYYEALNDEKVNPCYITKVMGKGADFEDGYKAISSMFKFYVNNEGTDTSSPAQYRYYQIPDWNKEGIKVTKYDAMAKSSSGFDLDAYVFTAGNTAYGKADSIPLVVGLHGGGNSATFFSWTTQLPELAKEEGFIFAAIQNHDKLNAGGQDEIADTIMGIIDDLCEKYPQIDESRIYLTGFSQGSVNSHNTAGKYAKKLAGIFPNDGLTNFSDNDEADIPIYFHTGREDALVVLPDGTVPGGGTIPDAVEKMFALAGLDFEKNEEADNKYEENNLWKYEFDAEEQFVLDDATTEYANKVTIGIANDENGNPRVGFQISDDMVHCTMEYNYAYAWDFISKFSRGTNGEIIYSGEKADADVSAELNNLEVIESLTEDTIIKFKPETKEYDIKVQSDTYGLLVKADAPAGAAVTVTALTTPGAFGGTDSEEDVIVEYNEKYKGYVVPLSQTYDSYLDASYGKANDGISAAQTAEIKVKNGAEEEVYTLNITRTSDDKMVEKFDKGIFKYTSTEDMYLEQAVELGVAAEKPEKIDIELPYYIYVPEGAKAGDDLPVVLALHGAGQRPPQQDEMVLRRYRMALEFAEYTDCIVVAPQCATPLKDGKPVYDWGLPDQIEDGKLIPSVYLEGAYALLQDVKAEYADIIDTDKIYCTGMSMGGMGTLAMALAYPDEWAAVMPCVGFKVGADDDFAALKDVPFMLGVSEADSTYANYPDLVERLNKAGVEWDEVYYDADTFLWTTPHFAWIPFYGDDKVLEWLFDQKK